MTGDPGWKRNAWPIRLSPNTSTQLSRDSSCSWTRKKKSTQGNDASLISPFSFSFPLQNSCDPFEKNTRVAILAIWFQEKRKEETIQSWRRDERAIFRKRKIRSNRGRIYELGKKNRESNNFSAGSIEFREYEFRSDDKNCMERPRSSLFFVQTDSKGRRRGRREKRKKKKKKEKRKNEEEEEKEEGNEKRKGKKRQSIFERITVNTIFSRVLRHGTELLLDFYFYIRLWTFNKAVFTRRERCEDPGWGEGRGEG